jgi:hypothetical protein
VVGSGDRSSPDRATSGQRLVNCLLNQGAAGEDEIRVTRSTTIRPCSRESKVNPPRTSTILLIFMLSCLYRGAEIGVSEAEPAQLLPGGDALEKYAHQCATHLLPSRILG